MANGLIICVMVRATKSGQMVQNMKVIGRRIKHVEKGDFGMWMGIYVYLYHKLKMRVSGWMTKLMVTVFIFM